LPRCSPPTPSSRPTTAIRSLGIEDPSLIRRLRNKYRAEHGVLQTNAQQTAKSKTKPTAAAKGVEIPERETTATSPSTSQASPSADWDIAPADIFCRLVRLRFERSQRGN
jgi:hypothetical protein